MLIRPKDIFSVDPPFLIVLGNQTWKVAREIFPHPQGVGYVEPFMEADPDNPAVIPGVPWHAGDNVWELDYATQIMTLDHPHHHKHPAWQLWLFWLQQKNLQDLPQHAH